MHPRLDSLRSSLCVWPPSRSDGLVALAVALAYFFTGRIGQMVAMLGEQVTPVWPPSGVALAALLLFGRRAWPGVWLGAFAVNLTGLLHEPNGVRWGTYFLAAGGMSVGAVVTAWLGHELVRRFAPPGNPLDRLRGVVALLSLGGVVACLVSSLNGTVWLVLGGFAPLAAAGDIWLTWWLGDAAGVFVFTPLLLAWFGQPSFRPRLRLVETICFFGLLLAVSWWVFGENPLPGTEGKAFSFVLVPLMVWPSLRCGQRGATTAILLITAVAVWGTVQGLGPFALGTLNPSLLVLEAFLGMVTLTATTIGALASEQRDAEASRQRAFTELEARIQERTVELVAANEALKSEMGQRFSSEKALAASESHRRTIIEAEPECVKEVSPEGRLLAMNPAGLAMLDAEKLGELTERPLTDFIAPEHRKAFCSLHQRVIAGGSGILEFESIGLKGTRRWLETQAVPLRDATGQVTGLLGVTRDISVRKRAEGLLAWENGALEQVATEASLPEVLESIMLGLEAELPEALCSVLLLDADGRHLRNGAAPSLPPAYSDLIDGLAIGDGVGSCGTAAFLNQQVVVTDIGNDPLWANFAELALSHGLRACWSTPIHNSHDEILGTFATYYRTPRSPSPQELDLIERAEKIVGIAIEHKHAEAALRENQRFLRSVTEASPLVIYIFDLDAMDFTYSNRSAVQGRPTQEPGVDSWAEVFREFITSDDTPEVTRVLDGWRSLADGQHREDEYHLRRDDDAPHTFAGREVVFARRPDGTVRQILGTLSDITRQKHAEEARQQLEAQLFRSQKMEAVGTLAGGIAHDFNNILAAIFGNVEMAREDLAAGHPVHASLEQIDIASQRARDLVRQILAFGRRDPQQKRILNLTAAVAADVKLLRATLPAGVEINFRHTDDVPDILADPTEINQVLLNLCTNSWHAMDGQSGSINLHLDRTTVTEALAATNPDLRTGPYARITVRDSGRGITPAIVERIFDPFFTTKEVGKGTGLGLSVVHGIIRNYEGAIVVSSDPGRGTTFELYLPAAAEGRVTEQAQVPADAVASSGHGQHILFLDDELPVVKLVQRALEGRGYHVSAFTDAATALAGVQACLSKYDLVVTDYNMPAFNGLDVTRQFRQHRPDVPLILTSGFITEEIRAEAEAAGVNLLLAKPYSLSQLCLSIHQLLQAGAPAGKPY